MVAGTGELITKRLRLRPWTGDDAEAALAIFGQREVARWLTPAVPRVADRDEMRQLLTRWITDLEIGWQITPSAWGHGYGAEAGHAVAHQAFANGVSEVFAVVRLGNTRGVATARRVGMEWVGETDKYYGLTLQIYRLTAADLDYPEPTAGVRRY
jgi:RimJ/RimL family protein N-acetyltransferase